MRRIVFARRLSGLLHRKKEDFDYEKQGNDEKSYKTPGNRGAVCGGLLWYDHGVRAPSRGGLWKFGRLLRASVGLASWSAGLGSALADVALGYGLYAPATFVIKALMAVAAFFVGKLLSGGSARFARRTVSHVCAALVGEVIMVGGYFAYESILYGVSTALGSLVGNSTQAVVGLVLSATLITIIRSNKALERVFESRK